ncbi:response regulator [Pseudorhodobacter turbinis]|uniref:histidine kinase n=1 Tax=Pseudorhodobacter turbinis TaxID=2500533 RepID=A0A4P8EE97_9RHOB|nr:response regulator [Pseudorhodobacter turbinis]QCO55128.1 response regulator [Pseudorhodobacter turbinis]
MNVQRSDPLQHAPQAYTATDEIKRQLDHLWRERWVRTALPVIALLLTIIYLPIWFSILAIVINLGAEFLSMTFMRGLDPTRQPKRYLYVIGCMFIIHFSFCLPAVLIWQQNLYNAKAFSVGLLMATLMQLISARSIHLPFGYIGLWAAVLSAVCGNTYYWVQLHDFSGLFLTSLGIFCGVGYTVVAMHTSHRLHRDSALDRQAALDSNRAKSRFLAQVSHELRTPLNAILGMGHAELRRNRDALGKTRLSVLIASAEGLSTLLDDILDMSAIEAGSLPIRPLQVCPSEEIAATLALYQPAITEAGLTLCQNIDASLEKTWVLDPQRLRQCLSNLLSNALKSTKQGGINIIAGSKTDAEGKPLLCIDIYDSGPGIPPHLHDKVFEPFCTGRARTSGSGLGLSISRTLARQMGGDLVIAANTADQSGAHLVLTIQMNTVQEPPTASTAPSAAGPTTIAGMTILVVDDVATNRLVAATYLRMLGANMLEATSGAEALTILERNHPDLVLLDMNMPDMNGLETLARIRALPGDIASLPVIAMTADAMAEHRSFYLGSGLDGYLAKPITPSRIEAEVAAVLGEATPF